MQSENVQEGFGKLKKEPSDFSSGLKLPKLETISRVKGGFGDTNAKVRTFKESRKTHIVTNIMANPGTTDGDDQHSGTGLFRTSFLGRFSDMSDSEEDAATRAQELKQKVKGLAKQRSRNRTDHEVHSRISKAFDKMEIFEKGIRSFDDTLLITKGRFAETGKQSGKNSPRVGRATDADLMLTEALKFPKFLKEASKGILMEDSAGSEVALSNTSENSVEFKLRPKPTRAMTNLTLKKKWSESELVAPESLVNQSGRHRLGQRPPLHEPKKSKELHYKPEAPAQKGQSTRKTIKNKMASVYNGEGNLTRLMAYDPEQGSEKEFTDFLQAHGGSTGGWNKEDHDTFLAVFMKWKHRPAEVIRLVAKVCPRRILPEIAAHLDWYEKYEALNTARKAYIQEWKIKKTRERQQIFKMAKEDGKAKIEGEKSRQEMIKAKREAEREREKLVLHDWKKSKKPEIQKLEIETDLLRDPDGPARTLRLGQNLQITKEKLVKLLPPTHQVRQVLTKSRLSLGIDLRNRNIQKDETAVKASSSNADLNKAPIEDATLSPSPSSGIFSESPDEPAKISDDENENAFISQLEQITTEPSGTGSEATVEVLAKSSDPLTSEDSVGSVAAASSSSVQMPKRSATEKRLAFYRSRDETMMMARRNAIQIKENKKNKGFLSTEEAKERISKIKLPSQVTRMTKGIEMRQNLRQLEAIEASVRQELKQNPMDQHRYSRVPTPELFKTGPTLNAIPKLGTPAWRTGNI